MRSPKESWGTLNLPAALEQFRRLNPLVTVRLRQSVTGSAGHLAAIADGQMDLALVSIPSPPSPLAVLRELTREHTVVVCESTHALQDPGAAAAELERCTKELGFHGALINGYTNFGDAETGLYYDDPRFWPFWERVEALGAPIYLHPRDPLPANQGIYEGHPELFGAVWTFTVETATHALRLMTSGPFDRFPNLTVIIGHLGETLPFAMWRIDHRVSFQPSQVQKAADAVFPGELLRHHHRLLPHPGAQCHPV